MWLHRVVPPPRLGTELLATQMTTKLGYAIMNGSHVVHDMCSSYLLICTEGAVEGSPVHLDHALLNLEFCKARRKDLWSMFVTRMLEYGALEVYSPTHSLISFEVMVRLCFFLMWICLFASEGKRLSQSLHGNGLDFKWRARTWLTTVGR